MQLSKSAIEDFQIAYLRVYGEVIDKEEANRKGVELLQFMQIFVRRGKQDGQQIKEES